MSRQRIDRKTFQGVRFYQDRETGDPLFLCIDSTNRLEKDDHGYATGYAWRESMDGHNCLPFDILPTFIPSDLRRITAAQAKEYEQAFVCRSDLDLFTVLATMQWREA